MITRGSDRFRHREATRPPTLPDKDEMTTPTQGELRTWARSQGIAVGDRGSLPAAVKNAYAAAHSGPSTGAAASQKDTLATPGDLASGLRGFLDAVDTEVRACSQLSQQIDGFVADLNGVRAEQARRLAVLDDLQTEASDPQLAAFLKKVIKPTTTQVAEVVPVRLR